jgi:hypothetical protein
VQSGGLTFVENDSIVEISPVRLSSAVSLQCIFNYPDENRFIDARVDITKNNGLFFTTQPSDFQFVSPVDLQCPVPDLPERSITWHDVSTNAQLPSSRVNRTGSYYCRVQQGNRGTYVSRNIVVSAQPPSSNAITIQGDVNEKLVVPGASIQLNCDAGGAAKIWLFNGQDRLLPGDRLINVTLGDSGFYQCHVGGADPGNSITSTYVNVVNMQISPEREFKVGRSLTLTCTLEHAVPERGQLSWIKSGVELSTGGRTNVTYSRVNGVSMTTLTVSSLSEDDSGDYKCKADIYTNYGTTDPVSVTTSVVVQAPPSPPANIQRAQRTMESAVITWEDSPSNNHLDITSYLIMWRRASDGADTATYVTVPNTMGTMSYTVEGLEVYTEYVLQIAATDAKCNGTFSQELRFFTLEGIPQNEPKDLVALPVHANIVELQWSPPEPPLNGRISAYRITYRETGTSGGSMQMTSKTNKFEVGGLKEGTQYSFSVAAGTIAGYGPSSSEVTATTISQVTIANPGVTPQSSQTLSTTVSVQFEALQVTSGTLSHYWLVVVKLPISTCSTDNMHPDNMFPHEDNFTSHDSVVDGSAYVAAELSASRLSFPFTFVFGDRNHALAQMSDNQSFSNVPLMQESCYTFFIRGFRELPPAQRAKRDVSQRRYRSYVTSQFMSPVTTLPATAWLQIRFSPVSSCSDWTDGADSRRNALLAELAKQIEAQCSCSFNSTRFASSSFSCANPQETNGESIVFKAEVQETNGFSAPSAVQAVSEWKNSGPTIIIDVSSFQVCSTCETSILSDRSMDCSPCDPPTTVDYTTITIGVSVGTFVILLILFVVIIVVIVIIRYRSVKQKSAYETNERTMRQGGPQGLPVVIENSRDSERPMDIDGKRYSDLRPQVVGGSATELPPLEYHYALYPPPPPNHPMHHSSTQSLSSLGNATPVNYPMMPPLYPLMGGRPAPPGMMPVRDSPAPHQLANHRRTKSGDNIEVNYKGFTPSHSRQPSDVTMPPDPRRLYDYMYYPYPYYHYYPYHYMPSSSGYASPSSRRMVSERDLEKHHLNHSGYSTPHLPRRPHTADMLETEFPRGGSPMLYHRPQDSVISQPTEQPLIHPFPRRGMKIQPAFFSTSHLPSKPVEGDHTMERFITEQLAGSQDQHGSPYKDCNREVTPSVDSVSASKTNVSEVSLSCQQPGSGSIESEVL